MSKSIKALAILGVVAGLGVAALPLSSYAQTVSDPAAQMTVDATIQDFISIENTTGTDTDRTVHVGTNGIITNNADVATGTGTVNVKTNSAEGFILKIKPANSDEVGMVNKGNNEYKIPAGEPKQGDSAWGFKLSGEDGWRSFAEVKTGDTITTAAGAEQTLKSDYTTPADKEGTPISIVFGVTADGHQQAGTYETTVVLTAVTKTPPVED